MQLLDFNVPTILRIQWVSKEAQEMWESKLNAASKVYSQLEIETVVHDVRPCMIAHYVDPNKLDEYVYNAAKKGLIFVPLRKEGISNSGFSHTSSRYKIGENFSYRGVLSKDANLINEFIEADKNNDDVKIGELLGFPSCCSKSFEKNWRLGYDDPIWQAAENTKKENQVFNVGNEKLKMIKINNSKFLFSPLLRYYGIRLVSHLPCSFDCEESSKVVDKWIEVGKKINLEGLEEAIQLLSMPIEWDCLKGIAEIRTPIFKIVSNSVNCYPQYIVQKDNDFYPKESAKALHFPWKKK